MAVSTELWPNVVTFRRSRLRLDLIEIHVFSNDKKSINHITHEVGLRARWPEAVSLNQRANGKKMSI